MRRKLWFWAAVALQVAILLGMVGIHGYTLATGRPVMLKTAPVDPWDPFRGDYVTLRYDISSLNRPQVPMEGTPYKRGQMVWVTLRKGDPYWSAVAVSDRRPQAGPDQVTVRGTVGWFNDGVGSQGQEVAIRYGIEQFYVPEGEGRGLEQQRSELRVEVLVDSFGRAAVHRVFLGDKEIRWQ